MNISRDIEDRQQWKGGGGEVNPSKPNPQIFPFLLGKLSTQLLKIWRSHVTLLDWSFGAPDGYKVEGAIAHTYGYAVDIRKPNISLWVEHRYKGIHSLN